MIGFVSTTPFLTVALWVVMATMHTFPNYHISVKINLNACSELRSKRPFIVGHLIVLSVRGNLIRRRVIYYVNSKFKFSVNDGLPPQGSKWQALSQLW